MNIDGLDLNLLRLFAAVYESRSVSRAAQSLAISQPAASNGLTRLRMFFGDPLFARSHGGVRPTPLADQLFGAVSAALNLISGALSESERFNPRESRRIFRIHMSDIGEARFLPDLMATLSQSAPGLLIETRVVPHPEIAALLDHGELDFAFGFLPSVHDTERYTLLKDRYAIMVREAHPVLKLAEPQSVSALRQLDFVAVRSHSETLLILDRLKLDKRIRLLASHFLALPKIVRNTNLGVVMPGSLAREIAGKEHCAVIEPRVSHRDFTVSLHYSKRREQDAGHRWLSETIRGLFATS
jgi:DNA-binding transcriptional LysR family regulator